MSVNASNLKEKIMRQPYWEGTMRETKYAYSVTEKLYQDVDESMLKNLNPLNWHTLATLMNPLKWHTQSSRVEELLKHKNYMSFSTTLENYGLPESSNYPVNGTEGWYYARLLVSLENFTKFDMYYYPEQNGKSFNVKIFLVENECTKNWMKLKEFDGIKELDKSKKNPFLYYENEKWYTNDRKMSLIGYDYVVDIVILTDSPSDFITSLIIDRVRKESSKNVEKLVEELKEKLDFEKVDKNKISKAEYAYHVTNASDQGPKPKWKELELRRVNESMNLAREREA